MENIINKSITKLTQNKWIITSYLIYYLFQNYGPEIFEFIENVLLNIVVLDTSILTNQLDKFLIKNNIARRINISTNTPENTIHYNIYYGDMLFKREVIREERTNKVKYTIYSLRNSSIERLLEDIDKCNEMIDEINIINVIYLSPWNIDLSKLKLNIREIINPYIYQEELINDIITNYEAGETHQSILISGEAGLGKSVIGRILSSKFIQKGIIPTLVEGFNPSNAGLNISVHIFDKIQNSDKSPLILMLDEIDISFKKSKLDDGNKSEFSSHADDKTEMNKFLDLINVVSNLIIIGTTNVSIENLKRNYPVYVRNGRFNKHIEFKK